jgi:hypothetical protein
MRTNTVTLIMPTACPDRSATLAMRRSAYIYNFLTADGMWWWAAVTLATGAALGALMWGRP